MRIAIFTDTYTPQVNGVANTVAKLASFLDQNNIPHLVFAPAGNNSNQPESPNVFSMPGFNFPLYPECKLAYPMYKTMSRRLNEFQPDIIHLVTPFTIGLCGLRLALKSGVTPVASFHTDFPRYLDYYGFGILQKLSWQFLRWFHNQCAANFCPSEETLKMLRVNGVRNVGIWGKGVDADLFNPQKYSNKARTMYVPDNKFAFLYVGRLAQEKNIEVLFEAYNMINKSNPEAHLIITGDGPMYKKLIRGAPPGVTFTGYKSGEALAEIYASCDAFVFPSLTETYGLVILEAMASGLPVAAAYAGGIKENLIHNYNGLACLPGDAEDLAAKMKLMLNDRKLHTELARNARQFAEQKSWDSVFRKLISDYEQAIFCPKSA